MGSGRRRPFTRLACLTTALARTVAAQSIAAPALDLGALGQVAVAGDFSSIQLYTSLGQQETLQGNSSRQNIVRQTTAGNYEVVATTDAYISSMCALTLRDGTFSGIAVGGNFTSVTPVGGQSISAPSFAYINGTTGQISPYPGLQGPVSAVYCDQTANMVYVGGAFNALQSSNVVAWLAAGSWSELTFMGFDGPVEAITQGPNNTVVFGGQFSGLKNSSATGTTSTKQAQQILNLPAGSIQSVGNATSAAGVVCPSNTTANNWLALDNTPAAITITLQYGFIPSTLRLYNSNNNGRGTQTFRFTALPLNGIMNLTYTDPATGNRAFCDATCPLSQSEPFQDFSFVNTVGMNSFRIDVSQWYGSAAGLAGVELFQNDTFSYAISALDQPSCLAQTQTISTATEAGGPWTPTPPGPLGYAEYLSASVTAADIDSTAITFMPDVQGDGNYTVVVFTPGCIPDGTCSTRGYVNMTGITGPNNEQFSALVSQTNYYNKYDTVYTGKISAASGSYKPQFVLRAAANGPSTQTVVASRIQLAGNPSTGGLNGLYQFNPNQALQDTNFAKVAINNAGTILAPNAYINAFAEMNSTMYVAGRFSDDTLNNVMAFSNNQPIALPERGLNDAVSQLYAWHSALFVAGNFSGTKEGTTQGLSNVAAYYYANNSWAAVGAGLNGPVEYVVPLTVNVSGSSQDALAFGGHFTQILASSAGPATEVQGQAIWIPALSNWYQNLPGIEQQYSGDLSASIVVPNGTWYAGGTFTSLGQIVGGVASLQSRNNQINIQKLPITIESSSGSQGSSTTKRAISSSQNSTGVLTGIYNTNNNHNITILGGHFSATGTSGSIQNLAFIDGKSGNVTGLPTGMDDNSTFVALTMQSNSNLLLAGGQISGQISGSIAQGLIIYDFGSNNYRSPQPAALQGPSVVVNSIVQQTGTSHMYVGGSFQTTSQGLSCPAVCMYDTSASTWSSVGGGLGGTVAALYFLDSKHLLAAGNLTLNGDATSLAEYNTDQQSWSIYNANGLPGTVSAFAPTGNSNQFWAAGTAQNGSTYITKINNNNLQPITAGLETDSSISSMVVLQLTKSHGSSQYLDSDQSLLVTGNLNLTNFGSASAALFNGSTFTPFLLSTSGTNQPGTINSLFYSQTNPALSSHHFGHSVGIAILVAFCAALGTLFLIFILGILVNRIQRQRAGYSAIPQMPYQDKNMNINRVPPERLFGTVGNRGVAPAV